MHSIGILITSRNNYSMMDKIWAKRINNREYPVLNIDEDSSNDQKKLGRDICKKYKFTYIDREKRGILHNIDSAIRFFGEKVKYIVWFQTDCWPLQEDFFFNFEKLVDSGQLNDFGTVGFNSLAENILEQHNYDKMIKKLKKNKMPIGVLARSPLEACDGWYCGVKSRRIKRPINGELFTNPFAIEIVAWFGAAINVEKYKTIDIEHPFEWSHSWDDICCQFLKQDIYNVALPSFYIDHRTDLKPQCGLPLRAARLAYKGDDTYHSLVGFTEKEWKKVWGFEYDNRKTFEKVKDKYKDTLLHRFYYHNPQNGPYKTFDIGDNNG